MCLLLYLVFDRAKDLANRLDLARVGLEAARVAFEAVGERFKIEHAGACVFAACHKPLATRLCRRR